MTVETPVEKIHFVGFRNSFSYACIGGLDSYVRRLSVALAVRGHIITHVHYGCEEEQSEQVADNITVHRFVSFEDALAHLANAAGHVVTVYVLPRHRIAFGRFRRRHGDRMKFHMLYSCLSDSFVKRVLLFADAWFYPFNAGALCVSPRLVQAARRRGIRAELLLPPVPEEYFCTPEEKGRDGVLRVTYMGRTDPGKGIEDAVRVFRQLRGRGDIEARIYGYPWEHSPESVRFHDWLLKQKDVTYVWKDWRTWSPDIEKWVAHTLRETDILVLPYQRLSSTMDTPLLLLEGMAALCAVVTKPLGDIPQIYGDSPFLIHDSDFVHAAVNLIESARELLPGEVSRLAAQNAKWRLGSKAAAHRFVDIARRP